MKCKINKFNGFDVNYPTSKKFVGNWSGKKKLIHINKLYLDDKDVSCDDVKAVLNHELEERKNYFKGKPIILAHCMGNKKEKKYLNKKGKSFPSHQKKIIELYRTKIKDDAPYYNVKC